MVIKLPAIRITGFGRAGPSEVRCIRMRRADSVELGESWPICPAILIALVSPTCHISYNGGAPCGSLTYGFSMSVCAKLRPGYREADKGDPAQIMITVEVDSRCPACRPTMLQYIENCGCDLQDIMRMTNPATKTPHVLRGRKLLSEPSKHHFTYGYMLHTR